MDSTHIPDDKTPNGPVSAGVIVLYMYRPTSESDLKQSAFFIYDHDRRSLIPVFSPCELFVLIS